MSHDPNNCPKAKNCYCSGCFTGQCRSGNYMHCQEPVYRDCHVECN